ncbi:uncharacterized protein LOC126671120 [Mercurialis annua]|uniref:uncharacterized protein LOC126671120 n=1 Tax=Mercurialis annua TaxID=3986 RepID=UPI00215DFF12|nr:uncharacterized protein LOC126671120 [Mercurialis annua]
MRRVLKLVHPGGFIELHQKSISADEVMKKNPRHFVTRPDVFRYPWIVVRPESVLSPGSVFYIVPFHTIHALMHKTLFPNQNQLLLQQQDLVDSSVELTYFHHFLKGKSFDSSHTRTKVDFRIDKWPDDDIFPKCFLEPDHHHCQESVIKSRFELEHFDDFRKETHLVDPWGTACCYGSYDEFEREVNSSIEPIRPLFPLDIASSDVSIDGSVLNKNSNEKKLKSCLKKENLCRSRGTTVRFMLPK